MRNSELKITSAEVSVVQYMVDISSSYEGSFSNSNKRPQYSGAKGWRL